MVDITRAAWALADTVPVAEGGCGDHFVIAMENFTLQILDSAWHTLAPVRVAEKYEYWMHTVRQAVRFAYVMHSANDAKNIVTDARLIAWNVYKPGSVHARDAQRHGILTARKWASDPGFRQHVASLSSKS
jgi:hypothetical protein